LLQSERLEIVSDRWTERKKGGLNPSQSHRVLVLQ
jgi:hypothetical protein